MKHPEHDFQKQVVSYLKYNKFYVFSVPNGLYIKNIATRKHYKAMGLTTGVSDLIIILPGGKYVCVELKTKTGKQSDSQIEFQQKIESLGGEYLIWKSLCDAETWVKQNK
jgi:hypothetical protein